MTCGCLLTSVFLLVLTCFYLSRTSNCLDNKNRTILGSQQVNSGKNRPGNSAKSTNNYLSSFGLIKESMDLSRIHLAVHTDNCYRKVNTFRL